MLCADRDKRLLLSRGLIGLFTSCNREWGGGLRDERVRVKEKERQPLRGRIMTFIRPGLLPRWRLKGEGI